MMDKKINVAIIGASGYTGGELVRLLGEREDIEITALVADSNAGKSMAELYPHFSSLELPLLDKVSSVDWKKIDVVFFCLPHATSQEIIKNLYEKYSALKIIDLSADFRIKDAEVYEQWYETPHVAQELQKKAVYGLTEIYRDDIRNAPVVACPGCYPTSILLPLIPLLEANYISKDDIIVDSKSGMSGAGRSAKTANLFTEINENIKPYALDGHRHIAEIEQELCVAAKSKMTITFTPHVVPMNRGILSLIYAKKTDIDLSSDDIKRILIDKYSDDDCVEILSSQVPSPRMVNGTNKAVVNVFEGRTSDRVTIISAIDNIMKGASGQAVQNMNIMFDIKETTGVPLVSAFP